MLRRDMDWRIKLTPPHVATGRELQCPQAIRGKPQLPTCGPVCKWGSFWQGTCLLPNPGSERGKEREEAGEENHSPFGTWSLKSHTITSPLFCPWEVSHWVQSAHKRRRISSTFSWGKYQWICEHFNTIRPVWKVLSTLKICLWFFFFFFFFFFFCALFLNVYLS